MKPQPADLPTATLHAVMTAAAAVTGQIARWAADGEISPATAGLLLALADPPRCRCTRPPRVTRSRR